MKSITNFLLIILLLFVSTTAYEFASLAEISDEVKNSLYGKSLLDTINSNLSNGGDIKSIEHLLSDLLFKLNNDQSKADTAYGLAKSALVSKINSLKKEIKKQEALITTKKGEREKERTRVKKININLVQYHDQKGANKKQIEELTSIRDKDHDDFLKSHNEHMDIMNALHTVIKELKALIGSISGKAKPNDLKELDQEKRDRLYKAFVQISKDQQEVQEFIQLATQADQKALNILLNLLDRLHSNTKKSYIDDEEAEKKSKKIFDDLVKSFQEDSGKLKNSIVRQNTKLKASQKAITKLNTVIENKKKYVKTKESELKNKEKQLSLLTKNYLAEKKERDYERRIIKKLMEIVTKRLANMSKYLKENTGS